MHDLFCPAPQPREFFVNVALLGEDRGRNAAAVAKEQGRSRLGRVGSLLGGLMGSVMADNAAFDAAIAESVKEAVIVNTVNALKRERWWASVTQVLLPPIPGQSEWAPFVGLGAKGHFMVFRIDVTGRLPEEAKEVQQGGLLQSLLDALVATCWAPSAQPEDPECLLARDIDLLPDEIQQALQSRGTPINAYVAVADAVEQYHTFFELHWSREMCAEAIHLARDPEGKRTAVA